MGNSKAKEDIQPCLAQLTLEEQRVIQDVLERDKRLQNEISVGLQLSLNKVKKDDNTLAIFGKNMQRITLTHNYLHANFG